MQTGVTVLNNKIKGTLKFIEGGLAQSGPLAGDGYFLALKFESDDWSAYDSVKVGLVPSQGTGLVELINDPDKNGVFKITSTSQKFKVVSGDKQNTYDLSGLVLKSE